MPYVCKKCDSEEVEVQSWVNPNTGMDGGHGYLSTDATWCKECVEEDLGIVYKDDPPFHPLGSTDYDGYPSGTPLIKGKQEQ